MSCSGGVETIDLGFDPCASASSWELMRTGDYLIGASQSEENGVLVGYLCPLAVYWWSSLFHLWLF